VEPAIGIQNDFILDVPSKSNHTDSMKIKAFRIELKEAPKVRQPWAPVTRKFKDKTKYNRRNFKLEMA